MKMPGEDENEKLNDLFYFNRDNKPRFEAWPCKSMYAKSRLLLDGTAKGQVAGATSKYCALTSPSSALSMVLPLRIVDGDTVIAVPSAAFGN